jgi:hypothetical protein
MMIKKILVFVLFFVLNCQGGSVVVQTESVPAELKKRITEYWEARRKRDFEHIYRYELPYLQYLHSKSWYLNFFKNAPKFKKIEVKKVKSCDENVCVLGLLLYKSNDLKSPIFLYDKWIKVGKIWYHKFNDKPLPVF